jgi:Uma2 family endonuclease
MSLPPPTKRFTPREYYELERPAEFKSDYYNGEIVPMAGLTARHSLISANIGGEAANRLHGNPCAAYESSLRLAVKATGFRTYPDVSVYCEPPRPDDEDPYQETYTNPTVLFEVVSERTEGYDRGLKAWNYRQIKLLKAYVLVSQESPHVEIYERQEDGSWRLRETRGRDTTLTIPAIGIELPLAEIYDRVEFAAGERPNRLTGAP